MPPKAVGRKVLVLVDQDARKHRKAIESASILVTVKGSKVKVTERTGRDGRQNPLPAEVIR